MSSTRRCDSQTSELAAARRRRLGQPTDDVEVLPGTIRGFEPGRGPDGLGAWPAPPANSAPRTSRCVRQGPGLGRPGASARRGQRPRRCRRAGTAAGATPCRSSPGPASVSAELDEAGQVVDVDDGPGGAGRANEAPAAMLARPLDEHARDTAAATERDAGSDDDARDGAARHEGLDGLPAGDQRDGVRRRLLVELPHGPDRARRGAEHPGAAEVHEDLLWRAQGFDHCLDGVAFAPPVTQGCRGVDDGVDVGGDGCAQRLRRAKVPGLGPRSARHAGRGRVRGRRRRGRS